MIGASSYVTGSILMSLLSGDTNWKPRDIDVIVEGNNGTLRLFHQLIQSLGQHVIRVGVHDSLNAERPEYGRWASSSTRTTDEKVSSPPPSLSSSSSLISSASATLFTSELKHQFEQYDSRKAIEEMEKRRNKQREEAKPTNDDVAFLFFRLDPQKLKVWNGKWDEEEWQDAVNTNTPNWRQLQVLQLQLTSEVNAAHKPQWEGGPIAVGAAAPVAILPSTIAWNESGYNKVTIAFYISSTLCTSSLPVTVIVVYICGNSIAEACIIRLISSMLTIESNAHVLTRDIPLVILLVFCFLFVLAVHVYLFELDNCPAPHTSIDILFIPALDCVASGGLWGWMDRNFDVYVSQLSINVFMC
jgi:hypothetical protein